MKLGPKEIPALRLGAAAVLKAYLGGSHVWPLGFDPASLFAQGEQGVWYDPSDLSTLYQDAAGTTPVTAVEQPVGLVLDKSGRGNHASQPTATSRPVLSARVNLLTKTEQFDDADWFKSNTSISGNTVAAPDGTLTADTLIENTANSQHLTNRAVTFDTITYTLSIYAKAAGRTKFAFGSGQGRTPSANFDLVAVTATNVGASVGASITPVGNGWFRCSVTRTPSTAGSDSLNILLQDSSGATSYTGDGTSGIYIWGADLRVANDGANLPPYQRVNTTTDYDTVGFPHYLRFDGVDDGMVTPTITPGTDKAQVFAGVRKLSDAASGAICELSADMNTNNGTAALFWDSGGRWRVSSKGTLRSNSEFPEAGPLTRVLTGLADIAGDSAILRVNGTQAAQSILDQGTGNYLAYPLYIGRRGGTTLPFNGHLYSLIVRFGANLLTATIEQTEKYINQKTRAY